MITCPTCGAQNDPNNRFCDQCGTRLDAGAAQTAAPVAVAAQPVAAAAATCPVCGAAVLPGEAFCDECGAPLTQQAPVSAAVGSDAPTVLATPPASEAAAPATPAPDAAPAAPASLTCRVCGHQNLPGDRFCENCGADLAAPPTPIPTAPPAVTAGDGAAVASPAPTPPAVEETTVVEPAPTPPAVEETTVVEPAPTPPAVEETTAEAPPPAVVPVEAAPTLPGTVQPDDATVIAPPTAIEPEPVAPSPQEPAQPPAPAASAERQRLEGLIAAHQDTIAQYEQMIGRYPAGAAPAFLTAGLDEARRALAQAEADVAAIPSGPDPAEVARLEGLIVAHRDTIAQYEQMIGRYPAGAAPAFLTAGLDEARRALAQAEADVAALHGGAATVVAPAAAPAPVSAPAPTPAPMAAAVTPVPAPATAETVVAPAAAAPAGPRLVIVDGGQTLSFPAGKAEIIVGREDPVSNIFPEIDLTSYGGETGGVSRQHARISQSNGQWTVTDLNSTNYTRLDGARLEPNTPMPLQDGARLQFGKVAAVFHV